MSKKQVPMNISDCEYCEKTGVYKISLKTLLLHGKSLNTKYKLKLTQKAPPGVYTLPNKGFTPSTFVDKHLIAWASELANVKVKYKNETERQKMLCGVINYRRHAVYQRVNVNS